jgi:hypothetical protein
MLDWICSFWIENLVQRRQLKKFRMRNSASLQGRFYSRSTEYLGPKIVRIQNQRFNNVTSRKLRWFHPLVREESILQLRPDPAISRSSLSGGSVGYFFVKSYYWCEYHVLMNSFWGISRDSEINRDLSAYIQTFIWLSTQPYLIDVRENTANWKFTIICLIYCMDSTDDHQCGSEIETQNAVGICWSIEILSGHVRPTITLCTLDNVVCEMNWSMWWKATTKPVDHL